MCVIWTCGVACVQGLKRFSRFLVFFFPFRLDKVVSHNTTFSPPRGSLTFRMTKNQYMFHPESVEKSVFHLLLWNFLALFTSKMYEIRIVTTIAHSRDTQICRCRLISSETVWLNSVSNRYLTLRSVECFGETYSSVNQPGTSIR